ncbi:MAG: hypothetical protein ACREA0_27460 [bacterium]
MTNIRNCRVGGFLAAGAILSGGPVAAASAGMMVTETVVSGSTQTAEKVLVKNVRMQDGIVSGVVVNRTPQELK